MKLANGKYPPAVVTYMSYSGLGIVRSLGRRGIPVYAMDPSAETIGMNSRFCTGLVCPPVETNEDEHVNFLMDLSRRMKEKPVLFATGDNTVLCYARHEETLRDYFLFTSPGRELIDRLVTKDSLFQTAVEFNVPAPDTHMPKSLEQVREISSRIAFPCLIKPNRSNSWHRSAIQDILSDGQKCIIANTPDELVEAYNQISPLDPDISVSEVIQGEDSRLYYFVSYVSRDGEILGKFAGRKVRLYPIHYGSASYVESVHDPELEEVSVNLLKNLNYRGLSGIEFKKDVKDEKYKLIEVNARYGLWDVLGSRCGVDMAHIAYQDCIGEKVIPNGDYRTGVKWVSAKLDTKAFLNYKREGLITFKSWVRTLSGDKQWAVFAGDDLRPFISSVARFGLNRMKRLKTLFSPSSD